MAYSLDDWHARYQKQATWTAELRRYLFSNVGVSSANRILDVGCGTGALETDLKPESTLAALIGLDIRGDVLGYAKIHTPHVTYVQGDALSLPFPNGWFDLVFCHFLLLWTASPLHALMEMARVTRAGGAVLALAEPDYGGRIDYPPELEALGTWQRASLRQQGANPELGRRLPWLFRQAGLQLVAAGVLGAQWRGAADPAEIASEWEMLRYDLDVLFGPAPADSRQAQVQKLRRLDETAWQNGERVLYVPTFYAWGIVPK